MAWLSGWSYRKEILIIGESGAGTNYQVKLNIGDSTGGDFHLEGHCTNFPQDIEVTDNDGTTLLKFWIVDLTADPLKIWIKVADDLGSNQTIYIYYGKNGASTNSDGNATFDFFDDFESYNTGNLNGQGGWSGDTDFDVSTARPKCGSKGVTVTDSNDDTISKSSISFPSTYGLKFYVNIDDTDGRLIIYEKEDTSTLTYIFFRNPDKDGNSDIVFGATDTTVNWAADTWYEIELIKRSNGNYDVWVNGVEKLSDTAPTASGTSDTIFLDHRWEGATTHYIDTFIVRKYNSPEPGFGLADSEETEVNTSISQFDGKIKIITTSSNQFDGKIRIKDVTTDLLDGKIRIIDAETDLLDGKIRIKDVTTDLLDGKIRIKDVTTDLLDGKIQIKNFTTDLLDGKILIKDAETDLLDGKIRIKDVTTDLLDGKIQIKNITTDLLDGKILIKDAETDLLDGKIRIKNVTTDLLDGKIRIKDVTTDLLDGKILIKDVITDLLDGKILIKNAETDLLDGKIRIKNVTTDLFDGKIRIKDVTTDLLDGKIIISTAAGWIGIINDIINPTEINGIPTVNITKVNEQL